MALEVTRLLEELGKLACEEHDLGTKAEVLGRHNYETSCLRVQHETELEQWLKAAKRLHRRRAELLEAIRLITDEGMEPLQATLVARENIKIALEDK